MRSPALARIVAATVLLSPIARAEEKVFVGYLLGDAGGIDFHPYTHVCHAFLGADGDGKVLPGAGVPSRSVSAAAHKAGAKVLLSLGGGGAEAPLLAIATRPEAEARYLAGVLGLVDDFDYDGLDFDWEYPDTKAETVAFERMARAFRAGLDALGKRKGRPMTLTMAASADPRTLRWLGTPFLIETMDWVNVMTYDYAGPWGDYAGHNAPLYPSTRAPKGVPWSCETTINHLLDERKLPPDRIALGIPLYGRGFAVAEPYASTKGVPKAKHAEAGYSRLIALLDKGWARHWDDETKTPWLFSPGKTEVIGYDDAESAALKARWARGKNLRGVFFWEIHGDRMPDGTTPVQSVARKALFEAEKP